MESGLSLIMVDSHGAWTRPTIRSVVVYQNIGGVAAKLLIPIDASSGYIGVCQ